MEKPEIQEMLEGMLSDEQASEVLHRMSVSPERLTEFREHMALREAMAQDARGEGLTEEEDDSLWAAVLGATGGLVTGGAVGSAGLWSWVGRAGAFLATGIAGFFIGTAVNNGDAEPTTTEPIPVAAAQVATEPVENLARSNAGIATADRVDTVYLTEVVTRTVPKIIYRDRSVDRIVERTVTPDAIAATETTSQSNTTSAAELESTSNQLSEPDFSYLTVNQQNRRNATTPFVPVDMVAENKVVLFDSKRIDPSPLAVADTTSTAERSLNGSNPNDILKSDGESDAEGRSPNSSKDADLTEAPTLSLMKDGFDIAYAERLGLVTPAPDVLGESDPSFSSRSVDLTYRLLEGRAGVGLRFSYGTFSEVSHTSVINFDLGLSDTIYVQSLTNSPEAKAQFVLNYRIPLFTERLALGLEANAGLSSTRLLAGGEISMVYLINDWLGAQIGAGYGRYWYTTQKERDLLQDAHENTGVAAGLPIDLQGTMVEGRYGLFFRF